MQLQEREDLLLILFGAIKQEKSFFEQLNIPYISLGLLSDNNRIADLYSAADVTVVPSFYETFGQTLIEAMACRKPVITTISGGIPEYTGQGNCILLKRDDNIENNLAINVKNLLENINYASALAEKGYHQAIKYNTPFYYKQFLEIITEE